jgi:hypothetical protein
MKWTLAWEIVLAAALATVFVRNIGATPKVEFHLPFVIHPGVAAIHVRTGQKEETAP